MADADDLAQRLVALGLDEREARVYLHLCLAGPNRAGEVAAAAGLKRTETYRTLEALVQRGFAQAQLTRPIVYEPVPPETVFARAAERKEREREQIEASRDAVLAAISDARAATAETHGRYAFRILQGRRAIYQATEAMLLGMRQSQLMASTFFGPASATSANRPYQATVRRAAEGVAMRFLLRDRPGVEEAVAAMRAGRSVEVRYFDPPHPVRMTIVDGREALVWLVNDPASTIDARGDVAMWTNAPDFVRAQEILYEALWAKAQRHRVGNAVA